MNNQYSALSKSFVFFSSLIFSGVIFSSPEKPASCPSASAIQGGGLIGTIPYIKNRYMVYNISHYATTSNWVFYMGAINAKSNEQALLIGKRFLATLSGHPLPEQNHGDWFCKYQTVNPEMLAIASLSGVSSDQYGL